jgi:hypothetical protein
VRALWDYGAAARILAVLEMTYNSLRFLRGKGLNMPTTTRILLFFTLSLLLSFVVPLPAGPHEGELDSYGCHYDKDQKNYHCHQGVFQGGSFPSKMEMIRLLKIQFINLGRPWPYADVAEEDITSPRTETQQ